MDHRPCSSDPDLWFGYADDDASDGAAKARVYEQSATRARTICLRRCPLAAQRLCAQRAVDGGEEYGVWAAIKLPGGQYRKRHELARAHDLLRRISEGAVNPRELPESAELLSRTEDVPESLSTSLSTVVVHGPLAQPSTAA